MTDALTAQDCQQSRC